MDSNPPPLRPPVKWHGGKFYLCHRIIEQFPPHHTYLEPYDTALQEMPETRASLRQLVQDNSEEGTRLTKVESVISLALTRMVRGRPAT